MYGKFNEVESYLLLAVLAIILGGVALNTTGVAKDIMNSGLNALWIFVIGIGIIGSILLLSKLSRGGSA